MRHPLFRWLAGAFAWAIVAGSYGSHALWAQDRVAPPRPDPSSAPATPTPSPTRHWWDPPPPRPASGTKQVSATAPAQASTNVYRLKRDQAGDSKPIILDADEIASWTEKYHGREYCVFLLRGLVLAQQGIMQARFQQGVAWVDVSRYRDTGKLHMELYAEGDVRIEDGAAPQDHPRAILDVTTRGEFRINAHRSPLVQQSRAEDPLVQRGRAEGIGPQSPHSPHPAVNPGPTSPIQPTSYEERHLILPPTLAPLPTRNPRTEPKAPPVVVPPSLAPSTPPLSPRSSAAPSHIVEYVCFAAPPGDPFFGGSPDKSGQGAPAAQEIAPPPSGRRTPAQPTAQPGEGPQPPQPDGPARTDPRAPDGSILPPSPSPVAPGGPPLPPPSQRTPPPPGKIVSPGRNFVVAPRQGGTFAFQRRVGPNGEAIIIFTGGVMLQVRNAPNVGMIDMEADRIVIWTKDSNDQLATNIQQPSGHTSNDLEVYLSGHVIIRQAPLVNPKREERSISADEVYYDVNRNVAIATLARLELRQPLIKDPIVATAQELRQTSINTFELVKSEVFSSKLPSEPGLKIYLRDGLIEDQRVPLKNLFGMPVMDRKTGQPLLVQETKITGTNAFFELEDIPFFWLPQVSTTAQQPLGPLQDFNFGYNHIFGIQLGVSLNMYQMLGLQPRPNTRWLLNLDYLSYRGPGAGTVYDFSGRELFGIPGRYSGQIKGFGMIDRDFDILGGARPVNDFNPTNFRGWAPMRFTGDEMPYGFSILGQFVPISDRNFVEQYYKRIWDMDPNLDTFLFLKEQQDNWAWSALVRPRIRRWVTTTQDLPRFDGWLIGQDFFKTITYTTHGNLEYASLRDSTDPLPQISVTDIATNTMRASWMQEAQVPFYLGPFKILPYGRTELTEYSSDLYGNTIGRAWEAGGVRTSIPLSHLYPGAQSELFNINGINHKIVFNTNYVYAYTNQPYTRFPQLDRLNDDATNQALRDIRPYQLLFNPNGVFGNHGLSLVFSPYYNTPQTMAIRRLLWDRIDTLSTMEQLQLEFRQRLQTKRGFPGNQHIVDWMILNTSASFFPAANRDNFGHQWSFLQYDYLWNLGDRTALSSFGWTDPFPGGVRVWTIGSYFNRPDRTNFYLGFRYIDPLQVRAVTASVTYVFSPKYAATASSTYDFGTSEALANSIMFTRMGSDIQVSLGVSYNALQNNFGVLFNIVPNLLPANRAMGPMSASGGGGSGVLK